MINHLEKNETKKINNKSPFVSVVMPIRNEIDFIGKSLLAVLESDYPANSMEIIIADGMSIDGTRDECYILIKDNKNVIIIDNPEHIVSTGLNRAIKLAKGDIVVRVDGHCIIAKDYISKCVNYLQTNEIMGVGGSMETIGESPTAEAISIAMSSKFGVGNSSFRTIKDKTMFTDTIPFPAYWREDILRLGLYDTTLVRNQDDEFNFRVRASGGKLLMAADIKSKYYSRASLTKLWNQYFEYGLYKVRVMQKHAQQMGIRHFIPAVFILSIVICLLLGLIWSFAFIILGIILASYLITNIIFSFLLAQKKGWHHLTILPVAFAFLHFSYGIGFLFGIIKFRKFW